MSSASTCQLTVRMNPRMLIQQRGLPICQVRLDFHSFSIAQPNAQSVCATDKFTVVGSSNNVPTICGDASGQHSKIIIILFAKFMYNKSVETLNFSVLDGSIPKFPIVSLIYIRPRRWRKGTV